jgi:hypothetical protein
VRSGPGAARTILLFHTISARLSKQPRMVGSTLGVYSFALILFLQEQIKYIIIILLHSPPRSCPPLSLTYREMGIASLSFRV